MCQIFEKNKCLTIPKLNLQNKDLLVLIKGNRALFLLLFFTNLKFQQQKYLKKKAIITKNK